MLGSAKANVLKHLLTAVLNFVGFMAVCEIGLRFNLFNSVFGLLTAFLLLMIAIYAIKWIISRIFSS